MIFLEFIDLEVRFIAHFGFERYIRYSVCFFSGPYDVPDFHLCVSVGSDRPLTLFRVETETEEIENRRKKSHLCDLHQRYDDTDDSERKRENSSNLWTKIRLQETKYAICGTSPYTHDSKLTQRKSSDDGILIFYLDGNLILHEISIA